MVGLKMLASFIADRTNERNQMDMRLHSSIRCNAAGSKTAVLRSMARTIDPFNRGVVMGGSTSSHGRGPAGVVAPVGHIVTRPR